MPWSAVHAAPDRICRSGAAGPAWAADEAAVQTVRDLYAAFAAISFVFVFMFVPETKGRSLEEMDTLHIRTVMKSARK